MSICCSIDCLWCGAKCTCIFIAALQLLVIEVVLVALADSELIDTAGYDTAGAVGSEHAGKSPGCLSGLARIKIRRLSAREDTFWISIKA